MRNKHLISMLTIALFLSGISQAPVNAYVTKPCDSIGFGLKTLGEDMGTLKYISGCEPSEAFSSTLAITKASVPAVFSFGLNLPAQSPDMELDSVACLPTVSINDTGWLSFPDPLTLSYDEEIGYYGRRWILELDSGDKSNLMELLGLGRNTIKVSLNCSVLPAEFNQVMTSYLNLAQESYGDTAGVSINQASGFTNSRDVVLNLSFNEGSVPFQVMISNDGGFPVSARSIQSYKKNTVSWKLSSSGSKVTKVVYIKYRYSDNEGWSTAFSDDIVIDTIAPELISVNVVKAGNKLKFSLKAKDNRSGLSKVQYSNKNNDSKAVTSSYSKKLTVSLKPKSGNVYVRVKDKAGNWSKWKKVKVK
jgi:hypothetical protein